jgi:glycosyltransferase 2 family protein
MAKARPSTWRLTLLKLVISLALVGMILRLADISEVAARFAAIEPGPVAIAIALCFSQILLAGIRWNIIGLGTGHFIGRWQTMRVIFAAMFCNQVLPTSIGGDIVRVGLLVRLGVPTGRAARTVVLDRTAGLLSLLTLMMVTSIVLGEHLPPAWPVNVIRSLPVAAIALVLGLLFIGDRVAGIVERWPRLIWVAGLLRDSNRVLPGGLSTVVILFLSYGIHCASAASIWVLARGLGVEIDFIQVLGFLPIVILMVLLPLSIAGWGVREGTIVTLFALLGIESASAFAVSLLWGIAIAVSAIVAGTIWGLTRSKGERLPDGEMAPDAENPHAP